MPDLRRSEPDPTVTIERDGRCDCGHLQSQHAPSAVGGLGHGNCTKNIDRLNGRRVRWYPCPCSKFTWVGWAVPEGER
jgi:hypothetical protein